MELLTGVELIYLYLKYLSRWNKSGSLTSIIDEMSKSLDWYSEHMEEMVSICNLEYEDTKEMTTEYVMSLSELLSKINQMNRDKKIDSILNL